MKTDNRTRARCFNDFVSVSALLYALAIVVFAGAATGGAMLWPATPTFGFEWRLSAYLPSLGGLTAGFVLAVIFAALGRILARLDEIVALRD